MIFPTSFTSFGPTGILAAQRRAVPLGLLAAMVLLPLSLTCCERQPPAPASGRLPVVATFSILGDMVANVGGDRIELTTLVGPNGDTHSYEPTPGDAQLLARAAVVFEHGLDFETWLDKLYLASGSKAPRVVATQGVTPRTLIEAGKQETDPHCWHDVQMGMQMVRNVADSLAKADPAGATIYQANAKAYLAKLEELDKHVVTQAQSLPAERRILFTSHDSMGYFAQRYGFRVLGEALTSVSTEVADPSGQKIAAVVQEIRQTKVPAIFTENMENPKLMEQIAREAGVRVDTSLYTDALGPKGSPGATYLQMERYNVDTIVGLLKP